jgi:tRNA G18 (ribose-2'-O)-methylase SpoU
MNEPRHERHKPPTPLARPRELVLALAPMRSNVNLSRIVRTAGCAGVRRVICCGAARVIPTIARDGADEVELETHRTLAPVLGRLREEGYRLVGLEQASESKSLYEYRFERKTALVVGNERLGLSDEELRLVDDVVEIPVYGLPYAYNAASATDMAVYEYCRQWPQG